MKGDTVEAFTLAQIASPIARVSAAFRLRAGVPIEHKRISGIGQSTFVGFGIKICYWW